MYRTGETPARLWLYEAATLSPLRGGADYRDRFTRENLSIQRQIDKEIGAVIEETFNLLDEFRWTAKFEDLAVETVSTRVLRPNRGP
jgi:hypothetical protein